MTPAQARAYNERDDVICRSLGIPEAAPDARCIDTSNMAAKTQETAPGAWHYPGYSVPVFPIVVRWVK